jgi:hypothetical protein
LKIPNFATSISLGVSSISKRLNSLIASRTQLTHPEKNEPRPTHTTSGTTTDGMMRYRDQRTGDLINIPVHNLASKTSPYMDFTGSTSRFSKEPLDQFL